MWTRQQLKTKGKAAFLRNYWISVLVALILTLLVGTGASGVGGNGDDKQKKENTETVTISDDDFSFSEAVSRFTPLGPIKMIFAAVGILVSLILGLVFLLLKIFVFWPMEVGGCRFFLENAYEKPGIGTLLFPFQDGNYSKYAIAMLLRRLYIFLWSLLFIVPGIVKSYEYRMVPYLLSDAPELSREEAFCISREMMNGQKMNAFILDLSFIGWNILSSLTCGLVGVFYSGPYQYATNAELFLTLKQEYFSGRTQF